MADANKRIDLAAPLLSVRRHGGAGAEATGMQCCKPDDAAVPGGVPFKWEHRPGHPKSVRTTRCTPPLPAAPDEAVVATLAVPDEAARFSDALSRVDSCFTVNCSVTGLGDAGSPAEAPSARGGVMMDRFLPAAKAVAVGSPPPQCTFRKAGACTAAATAASAQEPPRRALAKAHTRGGDSSPRRLPVEHSPANHVPSNYAKEMNDDDGWDVHSTADFASKRCGLLPTRCMKSTLLLLNPGQAMRHVGCGVDGPRRGRRFLSRSGGAKREMTSLLQRPRNGQHLEHDASMQTWEELYINSMLRSDRGCLKPGTLVTELDRTVRGLYTNQVGGVHPKATHLGALLVLDRSDENHGYQCSSAQDFPQAGETTALLPPKTSRPAKANGGNKSKRDANHRFPPLVKDKTTASSEIVPWTQPLLTLPPPKSPSESWLSWALPSVSNKPPATSFLGINVQPRKQTPSPWCFVDHAKVVDRARPRQIRTYDLQK